MARMQIIERPSPNHDARSAPIDMLVLHYTGMRKGAEALARLCDPVAQVSAHYTIDEDGTIYRHVEEARRAWHAGVSYWAGETAINARSIGIELVNPGHEFGYRPFAEPQIVSLIALGKGILARHAIAPQRVLGHSDVAPARKTDPGELFPWARLAADGIGLWPSAFGEALDVTTFAAALAKFGYGVPPAVDTPLEAVITAFQRHFRPSTIDGVADDECAAILAALIKAC
ncbi:MAG: N-acetylmuramoyl-L-alanine amidase [Rhizomicrobium sp.]|nr:N-acetylmuramoyl-L-alanine amidase [Rhizomicrobium sp.]